MFAQLIHVLQPSLLLCLMLFSPIGQAATLNIATIMLVPMGMQEGSRESGILYDIANEVAETAGFVPNNVILPFPRAARNIIAGKSDMTIMFTNKLILGHSVEGPPVMTLRNVIIGTAEHEYFNLEELRGKTVGSIRSASYDAVFDQDKAILKYELTEYDQIIKMLLANRLDAIIGVETSILHTLKMLKIPRGKLGRPLVLNKKKPRLQFSNNLSKPDRKHLEEALFKMNQSGRIQAIVDKYTKQSCCQVAPGS